jgi:hypothetical protein
MVEDLGSSKVPKDVAPRNDMNIDGCGDCAANKSDADWKVQATLCGIIFCVLVDMPKTSKLIKKSLSSNKNVKSTDTLLCRCLLNELVLEHNRSCFVDMED